MEETDIVQISNGACAGRDGGGQGQGRNLVIFREGRRYINNKNDEIIHGLSVTCFAPLFRNLSLAKV